MRPAAILSGVLAALSVSSPTSNDVRIPLAGLDKTRKESLAIESHECLLETLTTLHHLHTDERRALSDVEPDDTQFAHFLRDRVSHETHPIAPALPSLLRKLARSYEPDRLEVLSGFRHWKLNEMLRKKGRRVASESQHTRGNAVDFRIPGISMKQLRNKLGSLSWRGGLGSYSGTTDQFVHVDVGPDRRWIGR